MSNKHAMLVSAFLISVVVFAQKDQIKAAEKSLKGGNSQEAITILQSTESLIANATDNEKAQFFFLKGSTLLDLANKKVEEVQNLSLAAKAYIDLVAVEKTSGKDKYSVQAQKAIDDIKGKLVNFAVDKQADKKFKEASDLLFQVYELDTNDLNKLYFSATYALYDKEYDTALKYYEELKKQNYSGEETQYFAKNSITEKEDYFGSNAAAKSDRDSKIKLKLYIEPREEKIPSKRGEVYKRIASILFEKGRIAEAKIAFADAKKENPEDTSLIIAEAELYYKEKDFETYKKLLNVALEKNPNNADLIFNLGVVSHNNKDLVEAEKLYNKAISIDPNYGSAYLNLANLKLDKRNVIVEQMNKLGNSTIDTKKYDFLKKQSESILISEVLPLLEKANQIDSTNEDIKTLLLRIYGALDMTDKAKALKAK
jgi:tetratricopeptide (TPR) repeat protein